MALPKPIRFVLTGHGRTISLGTGTYVVGRGSDSDVQFDSDRKLSREHVRLIVGDDWVEIADLGSANGTWVNSTLVEGAIRISSRATLCVGESQLVIEPAGGDKWKRATIPEGKFEKSIHADEVTTARQIGGVDHIREAMNDFLTDRRLAEAKATLDPILRMLERAPSAPPDDAIEMYCQLAFRLALALQDPGYVETAVRIHSRRMMAFSASNLRLLCACAASRLVPTAATIRSYLAMLAKHGDFAAHRAAFENAFGANNESDE